MALPSIEVVADSAWRAARRFPLVLAAAVVAAWAAIVMSIVVKNHSGGAEQYARIVFVSTLGLPLLFALTLFGEQRVSAVASRWLILAGGAGLLAWFGFAWPTWTDSIQIQRYVQLSAAFHLMAAFLPFAGSRARNGFWQYNKALFLRVFAAAIYTVVLYAGLAIAMAALDKLFGVPMPASSYLRLWIVLAFVFSTWFFVGGVPAGLNALEASTDYPAALRKFTQFVLVPIVALYLLILTIYLGKVLLTGQWPSGWIGYLVASVAAVGILSWLLIHPLEEHPEYAWVKAYSRGFLIALMPAIVMLLMAIWKRMAQYGVTEPRYALVVLTLWLAVVAVYYVVTRSRNIQLIPASLCALALATYAGPWGMYSVSEASQLRRLRAILERDSLLANGRLQPSARAVSLDDRTQISAVLSYLLTTHGPGTVAPWLSDSLRRQVLSAKGKPKAVNGAPAVAAIMASMKLEYVDPGFVAFGGTRTGGSTYSYSTAAEMPVIAIDGYTHAIRLASLGTRSQHDSTKIDDRTWLRLARDSAGLTVTRDGVVILEIPLRPLLDSAAAFRRESAPSPQAVPLLHQEMHAGDAGALVYLTRLFGVRRAQGPRVTSMDGELFLKLPRQ